MHHAMADLGRVTVQKKLRCPCGFEQTIRRLVGRQHAAGHIKPLYCPRCRGVTEHEEADVYGRFIEPEEAS